MPLSQLKLRKKLLEQLPISLCIAADDPIFFKDQCHHGLCKHQERCDADKAGYATAQHEVSSYSMNNHLVYAMQTLGCGGAHASTITAFLDLPNSTKMQKMFVALELGTGKVSRTVWDEAEEYTHMQESDATLADAKHPISQDIDNKVKVAVSYGTLSLILMLQVYFHFMNTNV